MHSSTCVYAPGVMEAITLGWKRIKRKMKVVELKCELLNRAQALKGGKKESGISGELASKSCTFIIADMAVHLLVKPCQRFQYKTPIRSSDCIKLAIWISERPTPSGRHLQAQMSCVCYVEFRVTGYHTKTHKYLVLGKS